MKSEYIPDAVFRKDYHTVIAETAIPAVILEKGFPSNAIINAVSKVSLGGYLNRCRFEICCLKLVF